MKKHRFIKILLVCVGAAAAAYLIQKDTSEKCADDEARKEPA